MNQLFASTLIATALFAGAAQAQTQTQTPSQRSRAEVIAELKAAVESGEQQAMALQMEGVGHLLPKTASRGDTLFAKAKPAKKLAAAAEAADKL